ncbi:MAG TPA: ATP-grasp domain-containing protein [Candidatus Diapherotrites archaeon]|uniref:ATP-grasp domain-containing protein n=1 Tax=Candidatus Iainarchaeum sp. TaxID=3101447 RepID=A0A7J4JJ18_9ARCH|nr:ATP-grasp domain-containing protein [Candidatus Diapherotrites archaeon]HIH16345.1 ATP-grasp domain-containing protein [Candidatus Diapherotrites archaeon]
MNALCLLSKSFLSRLLLETLAKYRVPVHASKELRALLPVNLSFVDEARAKALLAAPDTVVYSNAEDSLPLVYASGRKPLVDAITVFKDKAALREKLRAWFPDFFFAELTRGELAGFHVPAGRTLFLKPSIGFCGRGNARVSGQAEWDDAVPRVLAEISAFQGSFNDAVLNADKFLVEDFIEGEEFACDAFFDTRGKPAVVGLSKHPFASPEDSRNVVYYTSHALLRRLLESVTAFLGKLGSLAPLASFPVHFEFRLTRKGLRPIEVNPLRFGGFGLADLSFHAFGVNEYRHFFEGQAPDWKHILSKPDDRTYAFVLGQRPKKGLPSHYSVDHEKFKQTFREVLDYVVVDHTQYPFFSTVYTRHEDENEVLKYLHFDYGEYVAGQGE